MPKHIKPTYVLSILNVVILGGLEAIASFELQAGPHEVDEVPLREVLDNFRIVIEPAWREIDGVVRWRARTIYRR